MKKINSPQLKACMILSILCCSVQVWPIAYRRQFSVKNLKTLSIKLGRNQINLWICDTYPKRQEGMMFLEDKDVPQNRGMIFVFTQPQLQRFWMLNTYIPLDIAYIDANGIILNIEKMIPLSLHHVPSRGFAKYAIEMKQGSFKRYGIKPGLKLPGITKLQAMN